MYRNNIRTIERDVRRFCSRVRTFSSTSIAARKYDQNYFKYDSDHLVGRHIGPREHEKQEMVNYLGFKSLDDLISTTVPASIRMKGSLELSKPLTESQLIQKLSTIASRNCHNWRSFIGMGYSNCHTPSVIMRNVLENPGKSS
jgi:glycine dehydrogenase